MPLTRRRFVLTSAGLVTGAPWVRSFAAGEPRDKVRLGVVGVADRGAANLAGVQAENVVALCEVDEPRADKARKQFPNARFFTDYRKMLDAAGKDLDAVVVSTPDHTHAAAAVHALSLKKHLYCEKPLARSVAEVRAIRKAAASAGTVTQMGTQIHAGENYRRVVEFVQSGKLGPVSKVDVWHAGKPFAGKRIKPLVGVKFDLNQWLGPVPHEFFYASHSNWPHFNWRWWWEFGGGVLQDMGCHFLDLAFWALKLTAPTTVTARGSAFSEDVAVPGEMHVTWAFPRAGTADLPVTWHHGNPGPYLSADEAKPAFKGYPSGVAFHTPAGVLVSDYGKHKLIPAGGGDAAPTPPDKSIPKSVGHHAEWLNAVRGDGKTTCPFEYSGPLTETVLLGNVAYRTGETITWDAAAGQVTNSTKAQALVVAPPCRPGWGL